MFWYNKAHILWRSNMQRLCRYSHWYHSGCRILSVTEIVTELICLHNMLCNRAATWFFPPNRRASQSQSMKTTATHPCLRVPGECESHHHQHALCSWGHPEPRKRLCITSTGHQPADIFTELQHPQFEDCILCSIGGVWWVMRETGEQRDSWTWWGGWVYWAGRLQYLSSSSGCNIFQVQGWVLLVLAWQVFAELGKSRTTKISTWVMNQSHRASVPGNQMEEAWMMKVDSKCRAESFLTKMCDRLVAGPNCMGARQRKN